MRARLPEQSGHVTSSGVRLYYESHGEGDVPLLLLPTSPIQHSRMWKGQVPYLANHFRVITFDGVGNGKSDRPSVPEAYSEPLQVKHALALLDALEVQRIVAVGLCAGARHALTLASLEPARVAGVVAIAPEVPVARVHPHYRQYSFDEDLETEEGWAKYNRHYWLRNYEGYLRFFFGEMIPEPHSSKQIEDCVGWALDTTVQAQLLAEDAPLPWSSTQEIEQVFSEICERVECPVLVLHGTEDGCQVLERGIRVAQLTGGEMVTLEGSGHIPPGRDPVKVNLLIREFTQRSLRTAAPGSEQTTAKSRVWRRALSRPRRALFVSSPIGLGHIQRDLAIARALREQVPDLEIHWWTQHPATRVLEEAGEYIHPACSQMASESQHWEQEASAHDLHAFYAFRRMDEIFVANFMLFHDVTQEENYDLWIGDESWEVDYFLHENPELKSAPYAFLTDVIGFLPVAAENDPREALLTADYNAEMIEQRARYPRLRDLSLYVGEFGDLPDQSFGPGLPRIRDWARDWFEEVGYVLPFDPASYRDPAAQRERLGYPGEGPLIFAAVGGTSIGRTLLQRCAEAFELLRRKRPDARMFLVTGPRIEPSALPDVEGMTKLRYVHDLYEHLACADAAVVQGGLSTTMELVGLQRPFVYFPLSHHWEQVHHVRARLERYGAGSGLDYAETSGEDLAAALDAILGEPVRYRAVAPGAAGRAAERLATLLQG